MKEQFIVIMDNASIHTAPDKREEAKLPSAKGQMQKKNSDRGIMRR